MMFDSKAFSEWLEKYALFAGVEQRQFLQDQTILVNNVACSFLYPTNKGRDTAVILVDAGEINISIDDKLLQEAMERNFENYLMNAPLFLFNKDSQRLIIAKDFEYKNIEPEIFGAILEALTMQALAWHRK
jgi:hypothetical protein